MAILFVILLTGLFFAVQNYVYRFVWSKNLDLDMSFSSNAIFEGERLGISVELSNAKLLPLPYAEVFFTLRGIGQSERDEHGNINPSAKRGLSCVFCLSSYRRLSTKLDCIGSGRGYYEFDNVLVTACNIMASGWRSKYYNLPNAVIVFPKPICPDSLNIPFKTVLGEIVSENSLITDPFEYSGLRAYEPGDSYKRINFKASARTGQLMSNTYNCVSDKNITIVLNLENYAAITNSEVYEGAIRLAAFLSKSYIEKGICVKLVSNGRDVLSEAEISTPFGKSHEDLMNIYTMLARINLTLPKKQIGDHMKPDCENSVFVLISSCCGEHVKRWFGSAVHSNPCSVWIVPQEGKYKSPVEFNDSVLEWRV